MLLPPNGKGWLPFMSELRMDESTVIDPSEKGLFNGRGDEFGPALEGLGGCQTPVARGDAY